MTVRKEKSHRKLNEIVKNILIKSKKNYIIMDMSIKMDRECRSHFVIDLMFVYTCKWKKEY